MAGKPIKAGMARKSVYGPRDAEVERMLDELSRGGMKKGHYIWQAVRQRMEREGLLPAKEG